MQHFFLSSCFSQHPLLKVAKVLPSTCFCTGLPEQKH